MVRSVATATVLLAGGNAQNSKGAETTDWSTGSEQYGFAWDMANDRATVRSRATNSPIWSGGLLPALLLSDSGTSHYVKPAVDLKTSALRDDGGTLALAFGSLATGELMFAATPYGLEFTRFDLDWRSEPKPINGIYFGTAALSDAEKAAAPRLDALFWPNWESAYFCIPGAKGAPLQSIFRAWDLGAATLPLGSFGPSLGTPYAAAYPRPIYAAALGGDHGWVCIGSGTVPDGALSLQLQSSSACLHLLYREDLWGALTPKRRTWLSPLRLSWAADPWHAYQKLFSSFPITRPKTSARISSQWNSWGDFRKNVFALRALADWTRNIGAKILCLDDRWESFVGSGEPDRTRFPQFDEDLQYIKSKGLALGFWQPVGWVDQPEKVGLRRVDLIVGPDGQPRRVSWDTNPRARGHYCLDPSSNGAVRFLRQRTLKLMEQYQPVMLKLDFGYGLPSAHTGVPRDPALRGERYSLRLLEIIADAARSVNKDVAIEYYSLHPLWQHVVDVVALDDLGDAGNQEAQGHKQWSAWCALAAPFNATIMASSGYDWNSDADAVLDSAVLGVPGAVLSSKMEDDSSVPQTYLNRRMALSRWYRRTTAWSPLWLNSSAGAPFQDPVVRCFGRIEHIRGKDRLTAVVLRDQVEQAEALAALRHMRWQGSWALIAQDDEDIFASQRLALLPVNARELSLPRPSKPNRVVAVRPSGEETWSGWTWNENVLTVRTDGQADQLLGFVLS
jgi:hypothetical protein